MSPPSLPPVTVLTPCLDAAGTLPRCLESVRAQDYPALEHVVIDGGSRDGSVELLEEAGVRFLSEPDRGLAHALNKGLAMASGEVVGWLNADDAYHPGAVATAVTALAAQPRAEWATGRCRIVDGEGREIRRAISAYKRLLLRRYRFGLFLTQNFVACPATFVRTAALRAVGGFDERYRISVDYELFLRLARRGPPVVIDRVLADFRMVPGTLSMSGFELQFREHVEQARRHGAGHPLAVTANVVISRAIVAVYRGLRLSARP